MEDCDIKVSKKLNSASFPWGGPHPGRELEKSPRRQLSSKMCRLLSRKKASGLLSLGRHFSSLGESLCGATCSRYPLLPEEERPMGNVEERSRNTTSLGPGASAVSTGSSQPPQRKGGASMGGSPSSRRSRLLLPGTSLLWVDPLLTRTLDSDSRHLPGVLPSYPHPLPARFIPFLISGVFFCSLNSAACEQPDCLLKIEYHTLNPIPGCPSLPEKAFALKTKKALGHHCPGYSETEVSPKHQMPAFAMNEWGERSPK